MNVAIEYVNLITGLELTELAHDGKKHKEIYCSFKSYAIVKQLFNQ